MFGTSLKAGHLRRYLDIAYLLLRYSRTHNGDGGSETDPYLAHGKPEELTRALEQRGPTFIKLGQLLSTRPDLLPDPYIIALSRLQDRVDEFPTDEAMYIIESELGTRINKVFQSISDKPVAAASLAQIYRAELRDGRPVAVKVQRPRIQETIAHDLSAIGEAAAFLDKHSDAGRRYEFARLLEEFKRSMLQELDYVEEARNLRRLANNLKEFDAVVIPLPHEDFSTKRVLTMDWIRGTKITALSPLRLNEIDGPRLAEQLFRAYLKQILVDGFFHADPHPGNVFVTKEEGKLAILDLGMTARVGPELQKDLLSLLLAISEGRAEEASTIAIKVGTKREGFNEERLRARIGPLVLRYQDASAEDIDLGRIVLELTRISGDNGLRPPPEMTMIGKTLLNIDQVVTTLDPSFEPAEVVKEEAAALLRDSLTREFSSGNISTGVLGLVKFAEKFPDRLGRVMDVIAANEYHVKVDSMDERVLIQGMQKIANRIATGVILASLIIGAAQLMRVETRFRLFEYPGFAMLLFLAAAGGGVLLLLDILYYDDKGSSRK